MMSKSDLVPELSLGWVVGGPNALGRDYQILAQSEGLRLKPAERARLESFNLSAAGAAEPSFATFFPLTDDPEGRWVLSQSRTQGAGERLTWSLVLEPPALEVLDWAVHRLLPLFHSGRPAASPPPLKVRPDDLGAPRQGAITALAREAAARASSKRMLVGVDLPSASEDFVAAVFDELQTSARRRRGWATSGSLSAVGSFEPARLFSLVFAPAGGTQGGARHPGDGRLTVSSTGVSGGPKLSLAESAWITLYYALKDHALTDLAQASKSRVFSVINGFNRSISPSNDPSAEVAANLDAARRLLSVDDYAEFFTAGSKAVLGISTAQKAERFVAAQALALAFRQCFADLPHEWRARLLAECEAIADLPAGQGSMVSDLAIGYDLVAALPDTLLAKRAAEFISPRGIGQLFERVPECSAMLLSALARALASAWRGSAPAGPTLRLAAGLLARATEIPREVDRKDLGPLMAGLVEARSWRIARLVALGVPSLLDAAEARRLLHPLLRWAAGPPFQDAIDGVELWERLILANAALSWEAAA